MEGSTGLLGAWVAAVSSGLSSVLFFPVFGIPFLVLWLVAGGVFFTLRLGFVNLRLFGHAVAVLRGKYTHPDDPGEVTHFQALSSALSATVGLGNIAGVAVAVSAGGPGAVLWMMLTAFLGMSTKFAEVTISHKYRTFDEKGRVSGGGFHYIREGLAKRGWKRSGKALGVVFALFCILGSLGGGNMFQSNQSVSILSNTFFKGQEVKEVLSLLIAVAAGVVLIGGIRRIARVAQAIVPLMALLYIGGCLAVVVVHLENLGPALALIFRDAFTGEAVGGGILGAMVAGMRRASFSNEAGLGSAPIAHAAACTREPVREGCVGLLEPFMDTIVICLMSGLAITVSGVYTDKTIEGGVLMMGAAFGSVASFMPVLLALCVFLFAYSTMISWSYYGERAWHYLFGPKTVPLYYAIYCIAAYVGGVVEWGTIIDISDLLMLSMGIPNLIGLYLLQGEIRQEMDRYVKKLKAGEFPRYG